MRRGEEWDERRDVLKVEMDLRAANVGMETAAVVAVEELRFAVADESRAGERLTEDAITEDFD